MDIARVHKIKFKYAKEPFSNDIANYIFIAYIYKTQNMLLRGSTRQKKILNQNY